GTAPSLSYALSLAGAPGADSNLDSNGASIFLYDINGVIVGSTATDQAGVTAGNTIFEISVDAATGVVTLTQHAEIDHTSLDPSPTGTPFEDHAALLADGLVNLTATATITDGDGDTATDSAVVDLGGNIRFLDDGPSLDVAAAADAGVVLTTRDANTDGDPTASDTAVSTANFSGVFSIASSAYGADGAGTAPSLSYALSLAGAPGADSNLDSNGASIFLYDINGVIVGSTATDQASVTTGNTIFEISVDAATGVVTLTQHAEIDHTSLDPSPTGAPFEDHAALLADGLVNLTASATITDGDGDTATDSETIDLGGNIRFLDDGPSLDVAAAADAGVVLTTRDANTIGTNSDTAASTANFGSVFSIASSAYGADGAGTAPSLSYALSLAGTPGADSNLDSNGASIFLYDINGVIVGSTATDQAGVTAGNTIFEISVDAATGVVTLTQHAEIDHTSLDPS